MILELSWEMRRTSFLDASNSNDLLALTMNIVAVFDEVRLRSEHGVIIANDELHTTLILILAFVVIKRAGRLALFLMLIGLCVR